MNQETAEERFARFQKLQPVVDAALDWALDSVSGGEVLIPLAVLADDSGQLHRHRLVAENMAGAVAMLTTLLESTPRNGGRFLSYAFACDVTMTTDSGRHDVILVETASHVDPTAIVAIQRYRKSTSAQPFGPEGNPFLDAEASPNRFHRTDSDTPMQGEGSMTLEELDLLRRAPIVVFMLVAAIDGTVDRKEVAAFQKILVNASVLPSPLVEQLIGGRRIAEVPGMIEAFLVGGADVRGELARTADLVESKLSPPSADAFKASLMMIGKYIAEASGGFFGFGNKISKEEALALMLIAATLRFDPTTVR